jgi:penicillin amidase
MGYLPSFWSPEDVARIRSHGLYQNLASEVERALVLRDFGPDVEVFRKSLEPPRDVAVPEGLDLSLIPADVLRVYELATGPVEFAEGQSSHTKGPEGSNNWARRGRTVAVRQKEGRGRCRKADRARANGTVIAPLVVC